MYTNWQNIFLNKDVHQLVRTLSDIVFNVFLNFIPNKAVNFDDREMPWMTEYIKTKNQQHDNIYKNYLRSSKNEQYYLCLQNAIDDVSNTICKRKSDY